MRRLTQTYADLRNFQTQVKLAVYVITRPEAIPLKSIDAPHIAEQLFSRVGIPEEILTDQGSNQRKFIGCSPFVHPIRKLMA